MKGLNKLILFFSIGLIIQAAVYFSLDYYFSPLGDKEIKQAIISENDDANSAVNNDETDVKGALYSYNRGYMAIINENDIEIYEAGNKNKPQRIGSDGRKVTFFTWLNDRNIAILAFAGENKDKEYEVILEHYNPQKDDHKLDAKIEGAPEDSKIVDVAYSTATNVVYMKLALDKETYRIYRTDANYDTRRIYVQASNIGKIAVFYDEDTFFYDDAEDGVVYVLFADSNWRTISPSGGNYRLIGLDNKDIYIAKIDENEKVQEILKGKLGVGFETVYTYQEIVSLEDVSIAKIKKLNLENENTKKE